MNTTGSPAASQKDGGEIGEGSTSTQTPLTPEEWREAILSTVPEQSSATAGA